MTQTDRAARLTEIFRSHEPAIRAYAARRVGADRASDVVADTFLVAWRRIDDVPADALPWLFGVARLTVANHVRSGARATALAMHVAQNLPPHGAEDAGARDAAAVFQALERLSPGDREVLMLIAWEDLEPARAAAALGCSRGTFAVRLHRARKRLVAELARGDVTTTVSTPQEVAL